MTVPRYSEHSRFIELTMLMRRGAYRRIRLYGEGFAERRSRVRCRCPPWPQAQLSYASPFCSRPVPYRLLRERRCILYDR